MNWRYDSSVAVIGFGGLLLSSAKIPPKRVERSTVKWLALFKDHHGVLGVPAGCGVGKNWAFTRRFKSVAELILRWITGECW